MRTDYTREELQSRVAHLNKRLLQMAQKAEEIGETNLTELDRNTINKYVKYIYIFEGALELGHAIDNGAIIARKKENDSKQH